MPNIKEEIDISFIPFIRKYNYIQINLIETLNQLIKNFLNCSIMFNFLSIK